MIQKLSTVFFFGLLITAVGCKKLPTYPDVPSLEYQSVTFQKDSFGYDEKFTLTAQFTDGDGDVGYNDSGNGAIFDSSSSQYYSDFQITLAVNGVWADTAWSKTRLPNLTPTGNYKALKVTIDKTDYLPYIGDGTIQFSAFIYDRALHKSNVITSPVFTVHTP